MTTSAEVTASERESYEATQAACDAEIRALKTRLELAQAGSSFWLAEAVAQNRRAERLRSRLARVLRLVEGTSLRVYWTEHNGGGPVWRYHRFPTDFPRGRGCVWSRRALPTPTPDKEPTR